MQQTCIQWVLCGLFFVSSMAVKTNTLLPQSTHMSTTHISQTPVPVTKANQLFIHIGRQTFRATLVNNATAAAFNAQLPVTLTLTELNQNEKYGELPSSLPAKAVPPGTIRAGDLMLYGTRTLVLFYQSFRTSYSYTQLGQVDQPEKLATALGAGNCTVTFSRE